MDDKKLKLEGAINGASALIRQVVHILDEHGMTDELDDAYTIAKLTEKQIKEAEAILSE